MGSYRARYSRSERRYADIVQHTSGWRFPAITHDLLADGFRCFQHPGGDGDQCGNRACDGGDGNGNSDSNSRRYLDHRGSAYSDQSERHTTTYRDRYQHRRASSDSNRRTSSYGNRHSSPTNANAAANCYSNAAANRHPDDRAINSNCAIYDD